MFVLKKLFKLRENAGLDTSEKPFMEHLEDLRDVIVKIVITLFIATIGCYIFRGTLIDVLRDPMEKVWTNIQLEKLPPTISPELWEQAKKSADVAAGLTPEQKNVFYSQFEDNNLRYYAEIATYYRASLFIEDLSKRKKFIERLPEVDNEIKALLSQLLEEEMQPSATTNAKGSVVYMQSLKPTETFMLAIKLSIFAGIIISFPFLLYFILQFVIPGLKENERKALWPAMIIGFGLFLLGVLFCYFFVLPKALDFFFTYSGGMGVENEWRIGDYITFTTQFTLIFGLAFELPVVVMTLVKMGLLSYQTMSNTRSYAVLSIFLVGAIITPTGDALTLSLLAVPMCLLYEMCIWLAYFHQKKELAKEAETDAEIKAYVEGKEEATSSTSSRSETSSIPVPVPVPGRISTDSEVNTDEDDHDYLDEDYDYDSDHFDEDYEDYDESDFETFYGLGEESEEGEEMDDGEIRELNQSSQEVEDSAKDSPEKTSENPSKDEKDIKDGKDDK